MGQALQRQCGRRALWMTDSRLQSPPPFLDLTIRTGDRHNEMIFCSV